MTNEQKRMAVREIAFKVKLAATILEDIRATAIGEPFDQADAETKLLLNKQNDLLTRMEQFASDIRHGPADVAVMGLLRYCDCVLNELTPNRLIDELKSRKDRPSSLKRPTHE